MILLDNCSNLVSYNGIMPLAFHALRRFIICIHLFTSFNPHFPINDFQLHKGTLLLEISHHGSTYLQYIITHSSYDMCAFHFFAFGNKRREVDLFSRFFLLTYVSFSLTLHKPLPHDSLFEDGSIHKRKLISLFLYSLSPKDSTYIFSCFIS
jgi:hypothetical protein